MPSFASVHQFNEFTEAFELGLTEVHKDELAKQPKMYGVWLREVPAEHFFDTDWVVSGLQVMPEKEIGSVVETDKIINGPTKKFDLQPYALGLVIQYEVYRWDLYSVFPDLTRELAKSATDRYNLVAYGALNNGFSTSDSTYQTFQSETIFNDSHTRLDGGTWDNRDTIGLSYLGIQEGIINLRKLVNERGRFVRVTPKLVITSVEQDWMARTLVNSEYRPETANNDMSTIYGDFDVHSSPYITTAEHWFLWCDKERIKMYMRIGDKPDLIHDSDVRTRNRVSTSYCSFEMAVFDSRGTWGSTGGA